MTISSFLTAAEMQMCPAKQAEALRRTAQALADNDASEDSVDAVLQAADHLEYTSDKDQLHPELFAVAA